jgi:hypothetical protein
VWESSIFWTNTFSCYFWFCFHVITPKHIHCSTKTGLEVIQWVLKVGYFIVHAH